MPKITFAASGKTYEVPQGKSFLDFCEENSADHPFGCTQGICGTCCAEILSGAENLNQPTEEELETIRSVSGLEGARLGCQLKINGDITIRPVE